MTQIRNYKFRIRPTASQAAMLDEMLVDFCNLYNACLQQRIEAYRRQRKTLKYAQQAGELRILRSELPDFGRWSYTALQQVIRRVDTTYTAFFRRKKGFPRFRAVSRYHAAAFRVGDGLTFRGPEHRLGIVGVPGSIKTVWHRAFPSDARLGTAIITRQNGKWYAIFSVEADFYGANGCGDVGVDLGLISIFATSDGHIEPAPRFERRAHKSHRRRQRELARCSRGSRRQAKARARLAASAAKVARQRRDHAHKLSRQLVTKYARIAFENLNIAGLGKGHLARSIHDASWRILLDLTTYKAESAGTVVKFIDPKGTSQICPACGAVAAKPLSMRRHVCSCGSNIDRDVAAAQVIRDRAFGPGHGLRSVGSQDTA